MKNLMQALKNTSQLTLLFIVLFFLGVFFSLYKLYNLPHDLVYQGSVSNVSLATWVFIKLSIAIIFTFLLGITALGIAIQVKKETIVYIEKKKEDTIQADESKNDTEQSETFDLEEFTNAISTGNEASALQNGLNKICGFVQAGQGAIYVPHTSEGKREVELTYGFALAVAETAAPRFEFGEGLVGQVAASGKSVYIDEIPEGYITIVSGLGTAYPRFLLIQALKQGDVLKGVLELATFQSLTDSKRKQIEELASILAKRLN